MDDNIDKLISDVLAHQRTFKDSGYIVKDSYPILYFGDYERYCASKIRIITVGLNPSDKEFPKGARLKRFPQIKPNSSSSLLEAYNNYFREEPYTKWFNSYKKLLEGIECSYYDEEQFPNRALHTDICTPLATNPTWSKLKDKDFKQKIRGDGVKLWHDLVQILKPNIIICSFAEKRLKDIQFDLSKWKTFVTIKKKKDGKCRKKPYLVKKAKIGIDNSFSYIFWGNQRNKPFGSISDGGKEKIGKRILKFIE